MTTTTAQLSNLEAGSKDNGILPEYSLDIFPEAEISVKEISVETKEISKRSETQEGLFLVKPAAKWIEQAKTRPIPRKLFLCLWYEGELCILFADTNLGKSIQAVQIAVILANIGYRVLYFDFELSDKQFEARYSNEYKDHYEFPDNLFRAEINPDDADYTGAGFESIEDYINHSIEQAVITTEANIVIIDNLTYLKSETEKAKDALPLMKHLKALKRKYGLSILALAHTPKRDLSKPITRNDLQGSKMLINFCDSSFAIGESTKDKSLRYIKQIKARNTEIVYDAENVAVYQITKPGNFLKFEFVDYGSEYEHLKHFTETDRTSQRAEVVELKNKGITNVEIARRFGVSEGAVRKWLKKADSETKN